MAHWKEGFKKVLIDPTSISETIEILNNIKERYEEHHNVEYTEDAINSCVVLTDEVHERQISSRQSYRCVRRSWIESPHNKYKGS